MCAPSTQGRQQKQHCQVHLMQHMLHHVMQSCCAALGNATRIHITTLNITFAEVLSQSFSPTESPKPSQSCSRDMASPTKAQCMQVTQNTSLKTAQAPPPSIGRESSTDVISVGLKLQKQHASNAQQIMNQLPAHPAHSGTVPQW